MAGEVPPVPARANWLVLLAASVGLGTIIASCASGRLGPERIRLPGSDTMLPLTRLLAQAFAEQEPGVRVEVVGGGSTAGIAELIAGRAELCAASRPLTPKEAHELFRRQSRLGVAVQVARDGLAVFVHQSNPVQGLSKLQLKGIFTGRIRRWEKVGGVEGDIRIFIRPPSSGTHGFFRTTVLDGEEYASFARAVETTEELVKLIGTDIGAIGYGGMAYRCGGVRAIAVDGVAPTPEAVRVGAYPLSRYLFLITAGPPEGAVKRFVDFALSPQGQAVVAAAGYVPLFALKSR